MQLTALEISKLIDGQIEGNPKAVVHKPSKIEEGEPGSITFLANPKYEPYLYDGEASVVIVDRGFNPSREVKSTLIRVPHVYEALGKLLQHFDQHKPSFSGISSLAFIQEGSTIADSVSIGAQTYIANQVEIGNDTIIYPQVFIGEGVKIGHHVTIYPGVKIYHHCEIGDHCVIHSNAVIGSDGFGFSYNDSGEYQKINQIGNVVLEDHVEIGSNTVIDRATMGSTLIKSGVKLDNLIQIGHNVIIGRNTAIAAQTGIAGSAQIGENCMIGGQVGIAGHIKIADGSMIQAQSGIGGTIKEKNKKWYGYPAIDYGAYLKSYAIFKRLPELFKRIVQLEKKQK